MSEKQKKGFALTANKKHINTKGRPVNSRNKVKLGVAQRKLDDASVDAAALYHAILRGDEETLTTRFGFTKAQVESLTPTLKLNAAKEILKGGSEEMKALTGDKGAIVDDSELEQGDKPEKGNVQFLFKRDQIEETEHERE